MLFDAHTHFQELAEIEKVKAYTADPAFQQIQSVLNATVAPAEWSMIHELARMDSRLVPFYGIHPWKVLEAPVDWQKQIAQFLEENPIAGVGETGLDKVRKDVDIEVQKKVFAAQLDLAREFARPFVVHCVRAWDWTVKLIERSKPAAPFILHFFNGPPEIMEKLIRLGGYISFNARQMDRTDDRVRDLMRVVPLERLLLETDFPYLGQNLESATPAQYVARLESFYSETARVKDIVAEKLTEQILQNGTIFTHRASHRS